MLQINKGLVALAIGGAMMCGISGCAGIGTAVVDLGTTSGGTEQGAKQIDNAQRAAVGEAMNNANMKLETGYAVDGVYTAYEDPNGITMVVSSSGFILKGVTVSGATAYRVSNSTEVYWFDDVAPTDISELAAAGAVIPEGITVLP